ncbi:MAG TPA: cupin domain-containing protein [Actinomycetota bacterium]|nr:cupin domain-containing protein [Actinomycetota bacterium]
MAGVEGRAFDGADETVEFPHGRVDLLRFEGMGVARFTAEPGWRWSESVKPIAGTDSCQTHHLGYVLSGTLHIVAGDGTEADAKTGDVYHILPGHDAWVVGDETFVGVEFRAGAAG